MKTQLTLIGTMAMACAAIQLTAMPTKEETKQAEPAVRKMLASERAAFKSGKMTRSEVAAAAMNFADKSDTDAAKLLLMKGAFVLYVQDGDLEKAAETMNALKAAIPDMPPQNVTNIIETVLPGAPKKRERAQLYKLLGDAKKVGAESDALKSGTHNRPEIAEGKKTYGGYTWSYRVDNDEATLVAEKGGKYSCAVSPLPTGHLSILPTLNYIKVTRIGSEAFRNCKELTSVTIPEGVTYIDGRAFDLCDGLKSVTLPSSLKVVGFAAFGKCVGLKSVVIPEGVTRIEMDAFNSCSGLESVVIPNSVTHIGERAFVNCKGLTSVTIPKGVKVIGPDAFKDCVELASVTMRGERPDAKNSIFRGCGKLKSIHVSANAKSWKGMKEWLGIPLVFDVK